MICLVLGVCTWTDLWRIVSLKTDQVIEEQPGASGFVLGWFYKMYESYSDDHSSVVSGGYVRGS